eukprot:TRINITY_DN14717_c0_g1_i2.p1 TRINITY_DN14717_c0_g1~~TRINITY_DN14717_c0_g1_i2.p1  ORF type:complete len:172 (+),score=38.31 TRINITY_DN14717_c0_g1_i2:72-587(+)
MAAEEGRPPAPPDSVHADAAQSPDLAGSFLGYVQRCPHVMKSIQAFVMENCGAFAALGEAEEHKLEYTEIHKKYLELLDAHVQAFLQFTHTSEEDFMVALARVQDSDDAAWKPFKDLGFFTAPGPTVSAFGLNALIDKTDYYNFAKMMQIQANGVGPRVEPPRPPAEPEDA